MQNYSSVSFGISIITVVYNGEKTIRRAIDSVLNQSIPVMEYIIIDGKSSDGTLAIVKEYTTFFNEKRIRFNIISENDKGIYDAMNKGIQHASGSWIGILNADDYYERDAIECVVAVLEICSLPDVIFGNMKCHDLNKKFILKPSLDLKKIYYTMTLFHPSIFVKKSIYDKYGLFNIDYKLSSDWELILRLVNNRKTNFHYIDKVLSNFYPGGAGSGFKLIHLKERFSVRHQYFSFLNLYYDLKDIIIYVYFLFRI